MSKLSPTFPLSQLSVLEFAPQSILPEELLALENTNGGIHDSFSMMTCQRWLHVSLSPGGALLAHPKARRIFQGSDAYLFFLQFACGLESQIQGETDVFGQVKQAFKSVQIEKPKTAAAFRNLFSAWLEDTKEIRSQFLQNIGGNNYGALARRLLNPSAGDRTVLLGAGLISKTVAPYFSDFDLHIWNRTESRLTDLAQSLSRKGNGFRSLLGLSALEQAVRSASILILATPPHASLDPQVIQAIQPRAKILHLGGERQQVRSLLPSEFNLFSLTDLFEIDREQAKIRDTQVRQAMEACHQRSLLRSLARSIHIAHGWEDLALFY